MEWDGYGLLISWVQKCHPSSLRPLCLSRGVRCCPSNTTCTFNSTSLTVPTSSSPSSGTYTITITGTSLIHTATVTLVVTTAKLPWFLHTCCHPRHGKSVRVQPWLGRINHHMGHRYGALSIKQIACITDRTSREVLNGMKTYNDRIAELRSQREAAIHKLLLEGLTFQKCAEKMNTSITTIQNTAKKFGNRRSEPTTNQKEQ